MRNLNASNGGKIPSPGGRRDRPCGRELSRALAGPRETEVDSDHPPWKKIYYGKQKKIDGVTRPPGGPYHAAVR